MNRTRAEVECRHREILRALIDGVCRDGFQPTLREISRRLGYSTEACGVSQALKRMERLGYVQVSYPGRGIGRSRAVKILRNPDGTPFKGFQCRP